MGYDRVVGDPPKEKGCDTEGVPQDPDPFALAARLDNDGPYSIEESSSSLETLCASMLDSIGRRSATLDDALKEWRRAQKAAKTIREEPSGSVSSGEDRARQKQYLALKTQFASYGIDIDQIDADETMVIREMSQWIANLISYVVRGRLFPSERPRLSHDVSSEMLDFFAKIQDEFGYSSEEIMNLFFHICDTTHLPRLASQGGEPGFLVGLYGELEAFLKIRDACRGRMNVRHASHEEDAQEAIDIVCEDDQGNEIVWQVKTDIHSQKIEVFDIEDETRTHAYIQRCKSEEKDKRARSLTTFLETIGQRKQRGKKVQGRVIIIPHTRLRQRAQWYRDAA